jgi:soluble methane monooxygenase-binding protein MmoD
VAIQPSEDSVRLIPCGPLVLRITEVEPLYRWEILREDELIQEGASISPAAAERDGGKIAKLLARRG